MGLEGEGLEGKGKGMGTGWAGARASFGLAGGQWPQESHSFVKGSFSVASLGRVGAPLYRGQYSPDKGLIWAGERSGVRIRGNHLAN